MKRLIVITTMALFVIGMAAASFAAVDPTPLSTTVTASVGTVFSIAFDADGANVSYPSGTGLTSTVDPTKNLNYLDAHVNTKPDIGVICRSNENTTWYLKASSTGALAGKLKFYLPQPTKDGAATTGTLAIPTPTPGSDWPVVPTTISALYTAGNDKVNTPFGTYCGFSIGVNGGGLTGGSYAGTITLTLTQTP